MAKEFTLEQALSAPASVKEFGLDAALGKAPAVERPDLGAPMGDDLGASIMATANTQPRQKPAVALPAQGDPNSISAQDHMAAVAKRKEESPDRSVSDVAVDSGITLLKGAIGLPESFVGLADIPTAGRIGKFLEEQGYKPKEAKAILDTYLSEAQQAANRKVREAKGFTGTLGAALQNPSVIATSAAESLPQMLGGAGVARGLMKAAPAVAPWLAGAAGEGLLGAGSAAEQMRQDEKSGLLSAKQALSAVGSGVGTAAFGAVGGRLANKLGLDDVETMLATGSLGGKSKSVADFAKKAGASGISEGVFEEMPQSAQEQMWMNYAAGKPIMEGVSEASAMGLVTGAAMGVAGTGASQIRRKKEEEIPSAEQMARDRGFLVSEPKAKPAGKGMDELIKLASEEPVKPDQLTPSEESRKKRLAEQQMVTDLEKEAEGAIPQEAVTPEPAPAEQTTPTAEQPAPAAEQEVAVEPPAEPQAGKPTAAELTRNQEAATEYDTPEQNLREGEAFGQDLLSFVNEEKDSYGRAALKNRKLTQKYADMSDSWGAAADAAKIAFAEGNYEVFRPYEEFFKKTAKALQAAIKKDIDLAKADSEALAEMEKRPSAAEEMAGAPAPMLSEVEEEVGKLTKDQEAAIAERENLEKRTAGTSLMQALKGTLNDNELSELGGRARKVGKNQFLNLKASKGQAGYSMEDMVDSGKLDIFLPEKMRPEHPDYVNNESAEYIRDKLRNNQFYTYDTELAIKRINQDIESLERQIQDLLSDDEINKELQYAANEQRELDQATEKPAAKGADGAAEQRETKAADDELAKRKAQLDAEEELNQREARLLEERKRLNEERLQLESPTKEDIADQEERKAKAAELDEREQIRKESEAGAGQFELKGEDGRQDTTGGLFEQPEAEPQPVEISTEEERKAALKQLKQTLSTVIPPFRSRGGNNKVSIIKPTMLSVPVQREILKIASTALDLGLPAAVLGNVKLAGATRTKAIALMSNTGWLMTGNQWSSTSQAEKLLGIIHELGHAVDHTGELISEKASWSKAHDELKNWYQGSANKLAHPLAYPFATQYKGKVRIKAESFAQAFGFYFTSPVDLQKNAPEAYSQIQSIVERIQNESHAARAAGTTKTSTAGIKVQPTRAEKGAATQPTARAVSPAVGTTERLEDRGAGEVSEKGLAENAGQTFFDITPYSVSAEEKKRNPSFKRTMSRLKRERESGKISDQRFINESDWALEQAESARLNTKKAERVRGADYIRQRLLESKRRGELSEEAVDFAEWFIQSNPQLVDDLGIGIKTPKEGGVGGRYLPFPRIMLLMKNAGNDETIVHEVLHHLERMMPEKVQSAIRSAWSAQLSKAAGKAKTENDKKFFKLLTDYHFAGDSQRLMEEAIQMIKDGEVNYENYQYVNPSEFWAVNGADITKGRFDAVRGGVLARLKNWLKELGTKMAAVFGIKNNAPIIKALDSLAKADGEFVSKKMLAESSEYASVGQNIFDQRPLAAWGTPTESKMDDAIYYLQNKQIDMKRVVDEIQKSIGAIDDRWNPYLMEELFHGRSAKQTRDFMKNELRPLLQEMDRMGVTTDELEEYLHNVHAEERNEQIAKVNPNMPDGGSGIDTADAQAYLSSLTAEQEKKYSDLARMVAIITKGTRQLMVDSGLESQETIDQWEETYGNYIPLNRDDVDYSSNHGMSAGQGYSVRGPASRRATGSTKQVVDILANIAMQRERTIVRAEKNRVATALYGLAVKNPNPKFWLAVNPDSKKDIGAVQNELVDMGMTLEDAEGLMKEPTQKIIDPKTGLVTERVNPVLRGADNVLAVRVNGKDRYVFFNQNDDRAKRMATALKGLDADQLGQIMTMSARFTRYFASMSTQYNPIFGVVNLTRDLQGALLQLSDTDIANKRKAVMKNIMPAIAGIYKDLRAERNGKVGKGEWSRLWDEFQQEGGQTGFRDQFSRSDERARALEVELNKLSEGKPMRSARAVFDWLSDYNETLENGVRLAAYKVALDQGLSKEKAASIAKNLTVNFNRKGQIATQANALFAFFNSAVQGTARLAKTMAGPAGKTIFYGGALLGVIQASMLAFAGFGDDEPPEFIKNKNIIIPLMNGKYISIPMPLGYNVIPSMFRIIAEGGIDLVNGKPVKAGKRVTDIAGLLMDTFNPIGNAGWSFQTLAPTIADPIVALFENRDWTGKPIAKKDFNSLRPTPGYTRAKEAASNIGKWTAEIMNKASGGTEFTPGLVSPTPDQIDYLIGQATGGVGRELLKINRTARSMVTGEELAPHNIPLAGRFYGDTQGSSSVANKFYANLLKLNLHQNEIEGRAETKGDVRGYLKENPEASLYKAADEVERNVQKLRKIRRDLVEKDAPKERVKAIEANITTQMRNLNTMIEKAEAKRKE